MPTREGIINESLRLLGEPPSTGSGDNSSSVVRARDAYEPRLRCLFEDYPWNFAEKLVKLAQVAEPQPDYKYAFSQPADYMRVINISDQTSYFDPDRRLDYSERAGLILSDYDELYMWYVSSEFLTQEGAFPQKFADLLAAEIAYNVHPVTDNSARKSNDLYEMRRMRMRDAKAFDAQSKPARELAKGEYVNSRHGYGIGFGGGFGDR